jgi:integrase
MTRPRRRARDSGSVYYAKKAGRWEAVVSVTDPDTGQRRRVKQTARSKEDAERLLEKMISERRDRGTVSRKDFTVADAIADLLRFPPASWRSPNTAEVNRMHAERLIAGLGSIPLARLTAGQVERHLREEITRARRPLAAGTVRDELSLLRRAIRRAQRDELVGHTTALLAQAPSGAATRRSKSMTAEQAAQLLGSGLSPWWKAWLSVALMLGLRPGELGALAWEDIDLAAGLLQVRHSLHETPAGLVPGPLKTERSRRTLAMPAAVIDALVTWSAEQAEAQQLAGAAWCNPCGLVFTTGFGEPVNRQKIHYGFRKVCKAAGLGDGWQPRELRHTFVSVMSASGVDIEIIADAAGHANSHITRTVYRHSLAPKVSAAAVVMDRVFGAGAEAP